MSPLAMVKLADLMGRSIGRSDLKIGLIDGPVVTDHPAFAGEHLLDITDDGGGVCARPSSDACIHGTFIAGILCARSDWPTPGICPGCTLVIRSIFPETPLQREPLPSATPQQLASAIVACIDAGVRVINLSLALARPSGRGWEDLAAALDLAARRGVLVVAAAGNQGALGGGVITSHPWVIPVVACGSASEPTPQSNLGRSIGRRGLRAPGDRITGIGADGPLTLGGTSVATPFVTASIALLWSLFPAATAVQVKLAVMHGSMHGSKVNRQCVVPPLLNAALAYATLEAAFRKS